MYSDRIKHFEMVFINLVKSLKNYHLRESWIYRKHLKRNGGKESTSLKIQKNFERPSGR